MALISGRNNEHSAGHKDMARRPRGHEKIFMARKRFGYFPQQFMWRGHRYRVQAVQRCWTISRKRLGHRVDRLCFRVRCSVVRGRGYRSGRAILSGTFDVYQDLNTNAWHLEKIVSRA